MLAEKKDLDEGVLVDQQKLKEAIPAIKALLQECAREGSNVGFTLTVFDHTNGEAPVQHISTTTPDVIHGHVLQWLGVYQRERMLKRTPH